MQIRKPRQPPSDCPSQALAKANRVRYTLLQRHKTPSVSHLLKDPLLTSSSDNIITRWKPKQEPAPSRKKQPCRYIGYIWYGHHKWKLALGITPILQTIQLLQVLQVLQSSQPSQVSQSEMPDKRKARTTVETMDIIRRA